MKEIREKLYGMLYEKMGGRLLESRFKGTLYNELEEGSDLNLRGGTLEHPKGPHCYGFLVSEIKNFFEANGYEFLCYDGLHRFRSKEGDKLFINLTLLDEQELDDTHSLVDILLSCRPC